MSDSCLHPNPLILSSPGAEIPDFSKLAGSLPPPSSAPGVLSPGPGTLVPSPLSLHPPLPGTSDISQLPAPKAPACFSCLRPGPCPRALRVQLRLWTSLALPRRAALPSEHRDRRGGGTPQQRLHGRAAPCLQPNSVLNARVRPWPGSLGSGAEGGAGQGRDRDSLARDGRLSAAPRRSPLPRKGERILSTV